MKCCDECLDKFCKESLTFCPAYLEELKEKGLEIKVNFGGSNMDKETLKVLFYRVVELIERDSKFPDLKDNDLTTKAYEYGKANGKLLAYNDVLALINRLREEQGR